MSPLPPLNALRAFEAAARRGGFAVAAQELNVTPAAVGQQVRHLEDLLGVSLFERDGRSLRLTDRGAAGLERLSRALNLMGEASAAMRDAGTGQELAIAAPADFAAAWLARRLATFSAEHEVALKIVTRSPLDAVTRGEASIGIVLASEAPPGLDGQVVMAETHTPAIAPGGFRGIRAAADLDVVPLIQDASQQGGWATWLQSRGAYAVDATQGPQTDDAHIAQELAEAGAGVALTRRVLATKAFLQGRLTPLFPDGDLATGQSYYLISEPGRRRSPLAQALWTRIRAEGATFQDAVDEL